MGEDTRAHEFVIFLNGTFRDQFVRWVLDSRNYMGGEEEGGGGGWGGGGLGIVHSKAYVGVGTFPDVY